MNLIALILSRVRKYTNKHLSLTWLLNLYVKRSCCWSFFLIDKDLLIHRARLCRFSASLLLTSIQREVFGKLHQLLSKKWSFRLWHNTFPSYSVQAALKHPSVSTEFENESELNAALCCFLVVSVFLHICDAEHVLPGTNTNKQTSGSSTGNVKGVICGFTCLRGKTFACLPRVCRDPLWVRWFPPPSKHVP